MGNLNDLIWTDEKVDGSVSPMGVNMHEICMYAFCQGVVGHGDGAGPDTPSLMSGFACGTAKYSHTGPC